MTPFCLQFTKRDTKRVSVADALRMAVAGKHRRIPIQHWKTINALLCCGTNALGVHTYHCNDCGKDHSAPHSCRNRHCPNCQRATATEWLTAQCANILPVPYFHVVFTLPHVLNPLIAQNQKAIYKLFFNTVSATLLEFGRNRFNAQIGFTMVLHTWSQTMLDHYHLHCVVPGGGLTANGEWKSSGSSFLFPVQALSVVFQAKFRDGLRKLYDSGELLFHGQLAELQEPRAFRTLLAKAIERRWVVYCKKPFAGPRAVLEYLSRYTHKVAIGNNRILAVDKQTVTFWYKDYADNAQKKIMTLKTDEFLRRFCLHILPKDFVKIRHYGLLGNNKRAERIARVKESIETAKMACPSDEGVAFQEPQKNDTPETYRPRCPHCDSFNLSLIEVRYPKRNLLWVTNTS